MAIPLISGPRAIGIVISLSEKIGEWMSYLGCLLGIALLGILLYFCLILGEAISRVLRRNGIGALNRVLGLFILGIAVQLIANGSLAFLQQAAPDLLK